MCSPTPSQPPPHPQVYPPEVAPSSHLPRTVGRATNSHNVGPQEEEEISSLKSGTKRRGGLRRTCPLFLFLLIILLAISSFHTVFLITQNIVLLYFNSLIYGFRTVCMATLLRKMRNTACLPSLCVSLLLLLSTCYLFFIFRSSTGYLYDFKSIFFFKSTFRYIK